MEKRNSEEKIGTKNITEKWRFSEKSRKNQYSEKKKNPRMVQKPSGNSNIQEKTFETLEEAKEYVQANNRSNNKAFETRYAYKTYHRCNSTKRKNQCPAKLHISCLTSSMEEKRYVIFFVQRLCSFRRSLGRKAFIGR